MSATLLPTTGEIREAFADEIAGLGGAVTDVYDDGEVLFLRATLPHASEVRPSDTVQAGVALRTGDEEVHVHPYAFRQVCRNGAILAQTLGVLRIPRVSFAASSEEIEEVLEQVRETVTTCAQPEEFDRAIEGMRRAAGVDASMDRLLELLPMLSGGGSLRRGLVRQIISRFTAEGDRSLFGVMNAVTSLARDTRDPETRWRLEELGGGVPALVEPTSRPGGAAVVGVEVVGVC